jgi:type IV pilus assembly protein PilX
MPTVSHSRKQNGVVLIVAMVLLLIMTMVGVSAMRSSITNERMAMHTYDRGLSFQAAEAALREAEQIVSASKPTPADGAPCANGICGRLSPQAAPLWESQAGWRNASAVVHGSISITPQFLIEYQGGGFSCRPGNANADLTCKRYQVVARSNAGNDRAEVILQSTVATE